MESSSNGVGKKIGKQLNFSMNGMILPEHPQAQLQFKLLALAKSRAPPPPPPPPAPEIQIQSQVKLERKRKLQSVEPKVLPPVVRPVMPAMQSQQNQQQPRPTLPLITSQSPKSQQRCNPEVKEGTPKKQKQCNCGKSRCLKLYCECFASGSYCDGCNCSNCLNNTENEVARREAIGATLERRPNAFRPKIANSPNGSQDYREEALARHHKGCNCKKSGCLKKYCECYQGGILCSDNCKCMDCKNFDGSVERNALLSGNHASSVTFIQLAANAAINGAIDSFGFGVPQATKSRKDEQLLFGSASNDQSNNSTNLLLQEKCRTSSDESSTLLFATRTSPESSKVRYRSPLADIIKAQDVRALCSRLVVVSAGVTKSQPDKLCSRDERVNMIKENYPASSVQKGKCAVQEHDRRSSLSNLDGAQTFTCRSDGDGLHNRREMSPGTLALMCDEKDPMFTTAESPTRDVLCSKKKEIKVGSMTEIYAEQERLILTNFRNFLNGLLTRESMRETTHSPAKHV